MKKLTSLILAFLLVFTMIPALAEINYNGNAPISDEKVTISWFATNTATAYYDFDSMVWMQELIKRANVALDLELIDSASYNDALMPRLAAGVDLPDVVYIRSFDQDMSMVNTGMFIDLTEMIDTYGFNIQKRYEQVPTLRSQLTTPDGKIYYMPVINTLTNVYSSSIMVNRWWLEQSGEELPTTTEEFYELCKLYKESDMNGNGEADEIPVYLELEYLKNFGSMWGIDLGNRFYVNDEGIVECSYASERYKSFLEYWNRMYTEGLMNLDFATANWDSAINVMGNNLMGFYYRHHDNAVTWSKAMDPEFNADTDELILKGMEPLEGPYGDRFYWGENPMSAGFAITKDCENPLAVFAFLDWCYSEEANTLHFFGIEGEHYNIVDGKIEIAPAYRNNNDLTCSLGNQFGGIPRVQEPIQRDVSRPQAIVDTNAVLKEYYKTPILRSYFLPEEAEVLQNYATDFNTYVDEMMIAFITGTASLDEFDTTYLAALDTLNVDELVEVYQAREDRK